MAQGPRCLVKPDHLDLFPRTHISGRKKPTPASCPLISTWGPWHICAHTRAPAQICAYTNKPFFSRKQV